MKALDRLKLIFNQALDKTTEEEREAYLNEACQNDPTLRKEIDALLKGHFRTDSFLKGSILNPDLFSDNLSLSEKSGTIIGRYKLLEKIGEGGMAVVYMAEQEKPIRRKVALKIIKLGMDTRQVIARFEAERQALAIMDHPNIAKVLDAGTTETGRPYFVMELVKGVSITEYCDQNNLSTKERLELFIQVCSAVNHAHQKGIIHRDIKPSNIMVTKHEGKPIPKVIDFGIAKATNQRLTEKTLFTRYAHIIGTPAYMSPEQAELNDMDVDTRTDIYSLGVLLYELLTGTKPFSEEELRKAGYIEMQHVIREKEPVKPSTKLSTLGETLTEIAKHHNSTPEMLRKSVRGDLDWIVMKAMEKERTRRFETPNELAQDVRRHLEHEPVLARGPGTMYCLHKFIRRHRSQTIAALAMLVIVGAVIAILSMWNRDRLQLVEAEGSRDSGILSHAREQYARAERDAALETIKPILNSKHVGAEAKLLNVSIFVDNRKFDEAQSILKNLVNDRPEIAGAAHSLMARILWESETPNAEKTKEIQDHRNKAEALLPETAEAYFLRAMTAVTVKEQLASLDKALQLDSNHYESRRLRAYTYYASRKYDKMKDDALVMTILRPGDPLGYSLRATALRELGKYSEAITDYDNALSRTLKTDPQYSDLSMQRCETLLCMGDYERVIADAQEYLKLSPDNVIFQYYIFSALTALGDYEKANTVFQDICRRSHTSRNEFHGWCAKYIFDTLEAGHSWHPVDKEPEGAAFLPMLEAEETYRNLSAKAHRVVTDGFTGNWSPDGTKLAYSAGVHGYSGVAVYNSAAKETDLLIFPGKDPTWSPDGKYIAFVRDCQFLRVSEFIEAERENKDRALADEEVWIMKADGTEPRRIARGGWPSWSNDSKCVYYHSRLDNALYSISIEGLNVEPKKIIACSNSFPSVSPDNKRVAYLEDTSLKIKDLVSQTVVTQWPVPFSTWGGASWSPSGQELCLGGSSNSDDRTGLWIYSMDANEPARTLGGQINVGSWSSDAAKLVFSLGPTYFEIWSADLNPSIKTIETLGPSQKPDEYIQEMLAIFAHRIKVDPNDAYAYSSRAHYYDCLNEKEKATADMRRWSAVLSGDLSKLQFDTPKKLRRVINMPFSSELVFSAERPVNNKFSVLSFAFEQKGRCIMKLTKMPLIVTSILTLCLFSGLEETAYADFTFGEPMSLRSVIPDLKPEAYYDHIGFFSSDNREMYITSYNRPGGQGSWDLWVLTRASEDDDWGSPQNLGSTINSPYEDGDTCISADGLTLYFSSNRQGGYGSYDIYMTTRTTKNDPWGPAVNMGIPINTSTGEGSPWILANGLEFYFWSSRPGSYGRSDIYVAKRATKDDPWGEPVNLGPVVNSEYDECALSLSPDGLLLLFSDDPSDPRPPRPGGYGGADLWMTRRASLSDPWQLPVNLGPKVNGSALDFVPCISPDGSMLFFSSNRDNPPNRHQAPIVPVIDFNGDGKVELQDLVIFITRWGTNSDICDIGPMPWGDGIVDENDLKVLMDYWQQDFNDLPFDLVSYWKLDETIIAGNRTIDCVGYKNATVYGKPIWLSEGGKINGAPQLDGMNDYISTPFVLNPASGNFSIYAWIKDGIPGQVILSQIGNTNLLSTDSSTGYLMTELNVTARGSEALVSETIITDNNWHHIGLVWDGSYRTLYVDDAIAAIDISPQGTLASSTSGLYIGAGKNLESDSYWSGMIDDVRIYNRVITP